MIDANLFRSFQSKKINDQFVIEANVVTGKVDVRGAVA